jgi:ABC-2 type transport system ATP-binding protein
MEEMMKSVPAAIDRPVVVEVVDVSKRFTVRKDSSLKERIVTLGRAGRRHREDYWALNDVSVQIRAGSTLGLIGHNGSGKSTLLKVIGGIIQPTSGEVRQRGRVAALLELGAGFHPDLTGRENVYLNASLLGLTRDETASRFAEILDFSGIGDFIDTQVKFYSSGMYVRLAFAVAVHTDPDILLVDEVLAVGDEAFQKKCMDKIEAFQKEGRSIIFVSHALGQIEELCDRVLLLDHGKVVFDGIPETAVERFREILREGSERSGQGDLSMQAMKVLGIEVCDRSGRPVDELQAGDPFVIRVRVRSDVKMDSWALGFSVDTGSGHMALASNTDLAGAALAAIEGERTVEMLVSDAQLGSGTYTVNANVVGLSTPSAHSLEGGATFTVVGSPQTIGPAGGAISVR